MTKKRRETRLWQLDPSVFEPLPRAGLVERYIRSPARSITRYALYFSIFLYPVLLVSLGLFYGGLVFWTGLAVSMLIMGLVIKKAGYSNNFASWDLGPKKFLGLLGGFSIVLAFVYGLLYVGTWTLAVIGLILAGILFLGIRRISNR